MGTVSGTKDYTVIAAGSNQSTVSGTKAYTVIPAGVGVVTGTKSYTVTPPTNVRTGSNNYTVVAPTTARAYKLFGTTLRPVRIGKRRGTTIDWLTPPITYVGLAAAAFGTALYDNSNSIYGP